jgi:hypothetical protein
VPAAKRACMRKKRRACKARERGVSHSAGPGRGASAGALPPGGSEGARGRGGGGAHLAALLLHVLLDVLVLVHVLHLHARRPTFRPPARAREHKPSKGEAGGGAGGGGGGGGERRPGTGQATGRGAGLGRGGGWPGHARGRATTGSAARTSACVTALASRTHVVTCGRHGGRRRHHPRGAVPRRARTIPEKLGEG